MDEELTELASTAATALVSAMGTDLWQGARSLMRGILPRGGRRRRELTAALDAPAPAAAGDADLVDFWTAALAQLLDQDPTIAQKMRSLTQLREQVRPGSPIQVNSATHSGEVFAVQQGHQHIVSAARSDDGEERR